MFEFTIQINVKLNSQFQQKKTIKITFIVDFFFNYGREILKNIYWGHTATAYKNKIFAIATGAATSNAIGPY